MAYEELNLHVKNFEGLKDENPSQKITQGHCDVMMSGLKRTNEIIQRLNLPLSKNRIDYINDYSTLFPHGKNVSEVYEIMRGLQADFIKELMAISLAFIPPEKLKYFEEDFLFGTIVTVNFPDAVPEIKCAGNCLAADLNTAAVFHLMRVVNIGLRELAWFLQIKKIGEKKLEYCRDEQILKAIESAVDKKLESVDTLKRDEKWEKLKAFYRGLLIDLRYFKDIDRDPTAHARKTYNENGALDVFTHVRDFMQRLAGHITTSHTRQFKKQTNKIIKKLYPKQKSK